MGSLFRLWNAFGVQKLPLLASEFLVSIIVRIFFGPRNFMDIDEQLFKLWDFFSSDKEYEIE